MNNYCTKPGLSPSRDWEASHIATDKPMSQMQHTFLADKPTF